jgi:hypothetical protein
VQKGGQTGVKHRYGKRQAEHMPVQEMDAVVKDCLRICHSTIYQEPIMPGKEETDYQEWISAGERVLALASYPLKKSVLIAGLPGTGKKLLRDALALPDDECIVTTVNLAKTPMPKVISLLREADVAVMAVCSLAALSMDEKIFLEHCFRLRRLKCVLVALTFADLLSFYDQQCVMESVSLFVNKSKSPEISTGIFFTDAYTHAKLQHPVSFLQEAGVQTGCDGTGIPQLRNALVQRLSAARYPAAVLAAYCQARQCILRRSQSLSKTIELGEKRAEELQSAHRIIKTQTGMLISRWEALFSRCAKELYAEQMMNLSTVLRNIDDGWPAFKQNARKLTAEEYLGYSLSAVIGMLPAQRAQEYAENRMRKYFEPLRDEANAYFARQADTLKLMNEQSMLRITRSISNSLQNTTIQFIEEFASRGNGLQLTHNGGNTMLCAECDSLSLIDTWCYRLRVFSDYFSGKSSLGDLVGSAFKFYVIQTVVCSVMSWPAALFGILFKLNKCQSGAEKLSESALDALCEGYKTAIREQFETVYDEPAESGQEPVGIPLCDAIENQMRKVLNLVLAPAKEELNAEIQKIENEIQAGSLSLASLSDVRCRLELAGDTLSKTFTALFHAIHMTPPGDDVLSEYAQDCELSYSI